ncbi:hypothetical protein RSOLAG1IB_01923 [Rhizoctonia solani AG-1 IB]|uniref:Uncharacterized protein n=1 Tax=Thanatephorus cucumeris (strain AG1-IB / isolate 7/3/14) TaxID=1108050 RepID=A0A0B7FCY3_THACB|nr:hypothetical protein RSOLAG1IB_01923 [Rhizoctonia solani AG-1 IB]
MVSSQIGAHMLPHCLVAGVVARLEKQRAIIYRKLNSFADTRPWIVPGPQFSRFLYHLWHGAGAGGGAVTWDDYVRSRQAITPI